MTTIDNQMTWKDVAKHVVNWLGRGEIAESCRRLKVDPAFASRMLKCKTTYPNFELLADLKKKADQNQKRLV